MEFLDKGGDVRQDWRTINELERERRRHAELLGITEDDTLGQRQARATTRTAAMHPFKLYQVPSFLRATDSATDWLKFRVRAGRVMGANATGTDGANSNPDGELYPTVDDITLTSGVSAHWFWLDLSGAGPVVLHSATPASEGWSAFPEPDDEHIPIGWVDTSTKAADHVAIVRQLLRTDVCWMRATGDEPAAVAPDITPGWNHASGGEGVVRTLQIGADDKVYAGGDFTHVNGIIRTGFAEFDKDLNLAPPAWFLTSAGTLGVPNADVFYANIRDAYSVDVIGHGIGFANGHACSGVTSLVMDGSGGDGSFIVTGSLDLPLSYGIAHVVGGFLIQTYNYDGARPQGLVRIAYDGTPTSISGEGITGGVGATLLASAAGGASTVYLTGNSLGFEEYNEEDLRHPDAASRLSSRTRVLRINYDGTRDTTFETTGSNQFAGGIYTWVMLGSQVLLLGNLTNYGAVKTVAHPEGEGGTTLHGAALMGTTGGVVGWSGVEVGLGQFLRCAVVQPGRGILLGGGTDSWFGSFTITVGAATASGLLCRVDASGVPDASFNAPTISPGSTSGGIDAIAVQSDGCIIIAGDFVAVNGETRSHIAKLDPNGALL